MSATPCVRSAPEVMETSKTRDRHVIGLNRESSVPGVQAARAAVDAGVVRFAGVELVGGVSAWARQDGEYPFDVVAELEHEVA